MKRELLQQRSVLLWLHFWCTSLSDHNSMQLSQVTEFCFGNLILLCL